MSSDLYELFQNPDKRAWLIHIWSKDEYSNIQPEKARFDKDWGFLVRLTKYNLFLFDEELE